MITDKGYEIMRDKGYEIMRDAAIVREAEALINGPGLDLTMEWETLRRAVEAKQMAQRPRCSHRVRVRVTDTQACGQPSVQYIEDPAEASTYHRCAEHKVTVTDLG